MTTSLQDEHRQRAAELRSQVNAMRSRPLSPLKKRLKGLASLHERTATTIDRLEAKCNRLQPENRK